MSNFIEYNDKIAFHPGYYIKELVEESGLTQQDFAKRLGTTPKNLSIIIRGEQSISNDIAMKLARMLDTSVSYWLNLQSSYDALIAEFNSDKELEVEREIFKCLEYGYFRDKFGLPDIPRKIDKQIKCVREFLNVSSLSVFTQRDMATSFRSASLELSKASTVKANMMVQIAVNMALKVDAPSFNKSKFEEAIHYALTLTDKNDIFYPLLKDAFHKAGVIFIVLPNISGSMINGATKKIGKNILLMVNDRRLYTDTFWFTLFHEIGHIVESDYGASFEKNSDEQEDAADQYAKDMLIPLSDYQKFVDDRKFSVDSIKRFARGINRSPGIVLGRLQKEGYVRFDDCSMQVLKHKYKVDKVS